MNMIYTSYETAIVGALGLVGMAGYEEVMILKDKRHSAIYVLGVSSAELGERLNEAKTADIILHLTPGRGRILLEVSRTFRGELFKNGDNTENNGERSEPSGDNSGLDAGTNETKEGRSSNDRMLPGTNDIDKVADDKAGGGISGNTEKAERKIGEKTQEEESS